MPELVARLEVDLVRATPEPTNANRKPTSRPPVDIDAVSDIDDAWNTLTTWVRDWCDTMQLAGPQQPTWTSVTSWLATHWPNAADRHPAAQEFAGEVLAAQRALHHHDRTRDRRWQPLPGRWTCPVYVDNDHPTCGGKLLEDTTRRVIRCTRCATTWSGEAEYERLGRMLGQELLVTVEQAAMLARVNRATIYRWGKAGQLPIVAGRVDKRDLAILATRQDSAC